MKTYCMLQKTTANLPENQERKPTRVCGGDECYLTERSWMTDQSNKTFWRAWTKHLPQNSLHPHTSEHKENSKNVLL